MEFNLLDHRRRAAAKRPWVLCCDAAEPGIARAGSAKSIGSLPFVLPGVVTAILWRFMYDPQLGLVNSLMIRLGLFEDNAAWLANADTAMAAVIFVAVWKGFLSMLIYLAALQNVDKSQLEAATIDGAGPWRRLIDVTLPLSKTSSW